MWLWSLLLLLLWLLFFLCKQRCVCVFCVAVPSGIMVTITIMLIEPHNCITGVWFLAYDTRICKHTHTHTDTRMHWSFAKPVCVWDDVCGEWRFQMQRAHVKVKMSFYTQLSDELTWLGLSWLDLLSLFFFFFCLHSFPFGISRRRKVLDPQTFVQLFFPMQFPF